MTWVAVAKKLLKCIQDVAKGPLMARSLVSKPGSKWKCQTEFGPQEMQGDQLLPNEHECLRRLCNFLSIVRSSAANSCAKRENCNRKVL